MTAVWACPHCKNILSSANSGLKCAEGHMFDRAKQGYVNLLPANKKRSLEPGDNAAMIDSRRTFLASGRYDFLMSAIAQQVTAHAEACIGGHNDREPLLCLDIGCGEGSYLQHIVQANGQSYIKYYGLDISKFAIKRAASLFKQACNQKLEQKTGRAKATWAKVTPENFAVASSYDIPALDNSVDIALSVFAPLSASEVCRVLKPGGILIRVMPGVNHLLQLKQAIYTQATLHEQPKPLAGSKIIGQQPLNQQAALSQAELSHLIGMTPLGWHGSRVAKEDLTQSGYFTIDFDFLMQVISFE